MTLILMAKIYRTEKGFTLLELMTVIGIMGILAGILIPQFTGLQNKARDTGILSAAGGIRTAMRIYYSENNLYPLYDSDINQNSEWNDLKNVLTTIDLEKQEDYNIGNVIYYDNTGQQDKYLLKFISASEGGETYFLGEKTLSNERSEASDLSSGD